VAAAVLETANVTAKDVACIGIGAPGLINTEKVAGLTKCSVQQYRAPVHVLLLDACYKRVGV
jgi:hypothetical protein